MGRILMTTQDEIAGLEITHTLGLVDGMGSTIHWQHRANEPFLEQILKEARDEAVERMLEKADMRDAGRGCRPAFYVLRPFQPHDRRASLHHPRLWHGSHH